MLNTPSAVSTFTTPACFGKEWDRNVPECAGGADPDFVHPVTGRNIREQCKHFQTCGSRVQATRSSNIIPTASLIRSAAVSTPTTQAPPTFTEYMRQKNAEWAEQQRQSALSRPTATTPLGAYPHTQPYHPGATYTLNYQMPAYLSTPEIRHPGEGLGPVLIREILRSIFKSLGHAVAHFFDHRVMKEPQGK